MLKKSNLVILTLLLTTLFLSGFASAQNVNFDPFEGAAKTGDEYVFPSSAFSYAGFFASKPDGQSLDALTLTNGGTITFTAALVNPGAVDIRFKFERLPYPDTEPSFHTAWVSVDSTVERSYTVNINPQSASNTFKSLLLYMHQRDTAVVLKNFVVNVGAQHVDDSDSDDNRQPIDTNKWFHQTQLPNGWGWYNGELQHYTDELENSYISNGTLKIVAKKQTYLDQGHYKDYTSARLNSKFAFQYGRVEFRAKMPTGYGTWPAVWMLGKDITEPGAYFETQGFGTTPWPAAGEIDILEHWESDDWQGNSRQGKAQSAMHTPSSHGDTQNHGYRYIPSISTQFHVYAMDWNASRIIFTIDDIEHYRYNPFWKNDSTWPFNKEMYLILNVAVESVVSSSFNKGTMEVDYIRVYDTNDVLIFSDEFGSDDSDNDGVNNDLDVFPDDPNEQYDNDSDGIGNNADPDDDNDGVLDDDDAFPFDDSESIDTDNDGVGNNTDTDDDGDNVSDNVDAFPLDSTESVDTDSDGIGNNADNDDDGDGILDENDQNPLVADEVAKKQIVSVSNSPSAVVGGQVSLNISYDVSTGDNALSGLGLRVHYDSATLEFIGMNNVLTTDIFIDNFISEADANDFDGDAVTDRFVSIAWASIASGGWPKTDLPSDLFTINFSVMDSVSTETTPFTTVNFSKTSSASGYEFVAPSYQLDITDLTWDFDANGHADALTDGLLLLRHTFGLSGDALINGAIALNSPLAESAVEALVNESNEIADIDNNSKVDALTDGLLLLRYLFGLRNDALTSGSVALDAQRTSNSDIEQYILDHMPVE